MTTVVVGGGIMGAATLWELARAGEETILLEAGTVACGATGKSAALVRTHYSNAEVVRMAVHSRDAFIAAPELLGCAPFYEPCGWLFLVDAATAPLARDNLARQRAAGGVAEEVDPAAHLHGLVSDGIAYALFEPDAGYADPVAATRAYVEAARREGAVVREGAPVDAVEPGRGVRVGRELVEADHVVLATGAWTARLAAAIGVEVPLELPREQDVLLAPAGGGSIEHAVSSQADRVYLRPAGNGRVLAGRGYPKDYELVEPDGYDERIDGAFAADVTERVGLRFPHLAGAVFAGGSVGLYEVTPDWHPILGPVEGCDGLHLATGGSGHCFKLGPAIGALVAGAITGLDVDYANLHTFSLSRFDEGRELRSTYGGNRA